MEKTVQELQAEVFRLNVQLKTCRDQINERDRQLADSRRAIAHLYEQLDGRSHTEPALVR